MSSNIKKFFNNQYTIGVITGIVLLLIGYIKFDYVVKAFSYICGKVLSLFKYPVTLPVWIIILIIIGFIAIMRLKNYITTKIVEDVKPPFFIYREDKFGDLYYKWSYIKDYSGKYKIDNIATYCPICKCRLTPSHYGISGCPNCNFDPYGKKMFSMSELESLIIHKIDSKEYLNKIS